jgi:hypothetical protein
MVSYVGDTGSDSATNATIANVPQIQAYTGSAWQNVDGLALIAKATISTGVASVTMNNVFSATYEAYKIVLTNMTMSAGGATNLTLGAANTAYYYVSNAATFSSGAFSLQVGEANGNKWVVAGFNNSITQSNNIDLESPFTTRITQYSARYINPAGGAGGTVCGYLGDTTSYTSFTLTPAAGTLSGGTIYVYGYRSA